jgi:hypothetical protein
MQGEKGIEFVSLISGEISGVKRRTGIERPTQGFVRTESEIIGDARMFFHVGSTMMVVVMDDRSWDRRCVFNGIVGTITTRGIGIHVMRGKVDLFDAAVRHAVVSLEEDSAVVTASGVGAAFAREGMVSRKLKLSRKHGCEPFTEK